MLEGGEKDGWWQADFKDGERAVQAVHFRSSNETLFEYGIKAKIFIGTTKCGTMPDTLKPDTWYQMKCDKLIKGTMVKVVTGRNYLPDK